MIDETKFGITLMTIQESAEMLGYGTTAIPQQEHSFLSEKVRTMILAQVKERCAHCNDGMKMLIMIGGPTHYDGRTGWQCADPENNLFIQLWASGGMTDEEIEELTFPRKVKNGNKR